LTASEKPSPVASIETAPEVAGNSK
jgi:hypothetical protein